MYFSNNYQLIFQSTPFDHKKCVVILLFFHANNASCMGTCKKHSAKQEIIYQKYVMTIV